MEDIDTSPTPPKPRKRAAPEDDSPGKKPLNLKGSQFVMPTPPETSPTNSAEQREGSPALSISTMTSFEFTGSNAPGVQTAPPSSHPPPAKKRKLTSSEKLDKVREKEAKEKEKAEQKARKEDERVRKDEEKRVKDEEKRAKAEERDAKKREKEMEEERKEQEKVKKDRSQLRLASFFGAKPGTPAGKAADAADGGISLARRKSLSLEPFDAVADQLGAKSSASPAKGATPQSALAEALTAPIPS
ncbi:hypothetical protein LTR53_017886, partial [Teratosphaeriaceae sp. CCFEE 6253]